MKLTRARKLLLILPLLAWVLISANAVLALTVSETGLETTAEASELPKGELTATVGRVISIFLSLVGVIFFVLLIYGGILWMTAMGNEETVKRAKNLITSAILGLIIIFAAYAIAQFVISMLLGAEVQPTAPTP
ncbi:MAG: hypothetical protein PHW53_01285 [Patescibacteria group bacterium]|nr:hypothetical protein [Patescibacteria group bacterium]